jgi:hypothetical protein
MDVKCQWLCPVTWERAFVSFGNVVYWEVFKLLIGPPPHLSQCITSRFFFFFCPFVYIIPAQIRYGFLSMERGLYVLLVHLQEGYETFPRHAWRLWAHFQTSKQKVMSGNMFPFTGYFVHNLLFQMFLTMWLMWLVLQLTQYNLCHDWFSVPFLPTFLPSHCITLVHVILMWMDETINHPNRHCILNSILSGVWNWLVRECMAVSFLLTKFHQKMK